MDICFAGATFPRTAMQLADPLGHALRQFGKEICAGGNRSADENDLGIRLVHQPGQVVGDRAAVHPHGFVGRVLEIAVAIQPAVAGLCTGYPAPST